MDAHPLLEAYALEALDNGRVSVPSMDISSRGFWSSMRPSPCRKWSSSSCEGAET